MPHCRSGLQLVVYISVVLSTIRFFLCSCRQCDVFDLALYRRHGTSCCSPYWRQLAESPANLCDFTGLPGYDRAAVGSASVRPFPAQADFQLHAVDSDRPPCGPLLVLELEAVLVFLEEFAEVFGGVE